MDKYQLIISNIKLYLKYINRHNIFKVRELDNYFSNFEFDIKTVMSIPKRLAWKRLYGYEPIFRNINNLNRFSLSVGGYAVVTTSYSGYLRESAYKKLSGFEDDFIFYFFYKGMKDNVRKNAEFCYSQMTRMISEKRINPSLELIPYISKVNKNISNSDLHLKFKSELYSFVYSIDSSMISKFISTCKSSYSQQLLFDILTTSNNLETIESIKQIKISNSTICFKIMDYLKQNITKHDYIDYVFKKNDYYGNIMKMNIFTEYQADYQKEIKELALSNTIFLKDCNKLLNNKITSKDLMNLYKESNNNKYLIGVSIISNDIDELQYCINHGNRRIAKYAMITLLKLNKVTMTDWKVFLNTSTTKTLNNVIEVILKHRLIIDNVIYKEMINKNRSLGIKLSKGMPIYTQLALLLDMLQSRDDKIVLDEIQNIINLKTVNNYSICSEDLSNEISELVNKKKEYLKVCKNILFYINQRS